MFPAAKLKELKNFINLLNKIFQGPQAHTEHLVIIVVEWL